MMEFRDRLSEPDRQAFDRFVARCGEFGGRREERVLPIEVRTEKSGDPDAAGYYVRGHAAVYNRKSLDLGGFQEKIAPGAFDDVLDGDPDVHLLWDHDMRFSLARTRSSQYLLELRTDPKGLHYYAKVAPTSFAQDLRVLMDGGVIDQASFAFTVADDTWETVNRDKESEYVLRTINRVDQLFDVTITAQGAYPQTDSTVVRAYAEAYANSRAVLIDRDLESTDEEELEESADVTDVSDDAAQADDPAAVEETPAAQADEPVAGPEPHREVASEVKSNLLLRTAQMRARHALDRHRLLREGYSQGEPDEQGGGTPPAA